MLDDDLLSHGETPHYHRRCIVSLLSSGWDQVVPTLYGRQAILLLSRLPFQGFATANSDSDAYDRYRDSASFRLVYCSPTLVLSPAVFSAPDCLGVIWSSLTGN